MKKKTTWAASVVKKQLQTCCKHQTFSLETGDDCNTSQGSTQRVINISSPIRELFHHHQQEVDTSTPVLQRRKSFNVLHGRSLLSAGTPEPLTPFRKSVESAIPLCRSASAGTTFINKATSSSQQRLKEESEQQPVAVVAKVVPPCPPLQPPRKVVLHKSGPLPVLQQLLRNGGGVVGSSPLHVKKQLSGPLPGGRPPVAPGSSGAPSPLLPPRISRVKFSPTTTNILLTVKDRTSPPQCGFQPSSPEFAKIETIASFRDEEEEVEAPLSAEPEVQDTEEKEAHAAAVKIQAAYRGHRARAALASRERGTSDDDDDGEVTVPSISTQMSRTDPQKQLRKTSPAPQQQQRGGLVALRDNKGWNGSIRSAQDHQALLRSRQEAAMKRERAMEYALSRQRWRSGKPASSLKPWMITPDDRVPDKPGWVRNWLERATRMDNNANPQLPKVEDPPGPPESESLSMKSTVGMCTTDIGSLGLPEANTHNLGWPLSLRQQHAAGLLHHAGAATPPPHKFPCEFSTSTTSGESGAPGDQSRTPHLHYHRRSKDDRESVGSCDGPQPVILIKVPSPAASKPRIQKNSGNSKDNKAPSREKMLHQEHPQSQVSVALSDGNSDDTTAASIQRPLWR